MKILFIRLRLIGDVIFTTPSIRAVKRCLPDAHLTYVVEREAAPILSRNPHLSDLIVVDRPQGLQRLTYDFALAESLRAARFDAVIDFHGGPRSSWLTWCTRAPLRIGYSVPFRNWAYTDHVPRSRQLEARHSVVNQWDLLAALDERLGKTPDPQRDSVEMTEDLDVTGAIKHRLAQAGVGPTNQLIVIHVSAGNAFRQWPADYFVQAIATLAKSDPRRRFVITSGPSDRGAKNQIVAALSTQVRQLVMLDEELDLVELRSLIGLAALFIGGDTGPLHLAATTSVPIVGIYGPTLAARSAPWRDPTYSVETADIGTLSCRPCNQRHCEPGDFRCLTRLAPSIVVAAAERALEQCRVTSS